MNDEQRWYVVHRTEHIEPGTSYVLCECSDGTIAQQVELIAVDLRAVSRAEMLQHPALAEALWAWDAGDDSVCRREAAAVSAIVEAEEFLSS